MRTRLFCAVAAVLLVTGCGGGSGSAPTLPNSGGGVSTQTQSEAAVSTANSIGSTVKSLTDTTNTISIASGGGAAGAARATLSLNVCNNGVEFFAPDKNGDANSTETQVFYDAGCTQLARDAVRIVASTSSSSETVARTVKLYALGNTTPIATRAESVAISNASFDQYGFPLAANGFDRVATGELDLAGSKTIVSDDEEVLLPVSGGSNTYCSDSAGFNATGIAKLGETFGWQGGVLSGGTRVVNSDGSVTWTATHSGTAFKGAIGSLSVNQGVANTNCPIAAPDFTLAGGTSIGSFNLPISATYKAGVLVSLSISNAQLANGNTLNVTTNTSVAPTSTSYINGVVSNGSTQVATFNVDTFGDGTLTVTAFGAQYVITDWHVIR